MKFIVVHGGAGSHGSTSGRDVKSALRSACRQALLNTVTSSTSTVEHAIMYLEDHPLFNAGYGSNLTIEGTVECDAAIMDENGFGSVSSVSEVKNPISLARQILDHSRVPDHLYRIPPLTLVSHGAHAFARTANLNLVEPQHLITDKARKQWARWKTRLNNPLDVPRTEDEDSVFQDTVGAVVWDTKANEFAAGVSSGGILLKHAGRVGEAAVYGAGCWAQNCSVSGERSGMACSVSGSGEYIIRANLARSICHAVDVDIQKDGDIHETLRKVLVEEFWLPSRSPSNPDPSAGIVLLVAEADDDGLCTARGWCAFTTASMAVGYSSSDQSAKAVIFRRPMAHASKAGGPHVFITGFTM